MVNLPVILDRFNALPPAFALRRLAQYAQKMKSWKSEPFEVKVCLRSGQTLSGVIIGYAQAANNEESVLFSEGKDVSQTLSYIPLADVAALQVTLRQEMVEILSEKDVPSSSESVPTRLELKRRAAALNQELQRKGCAVTLDCPWGNFPETSDTLYGIAQVLPRLQETLVAIGRDPAGVQALKAVSMLWLRPTEGAPLQAVRQGNAIDLNYDVRRPLTDHFQEDLKKQIESVL